jgi:hypothetical protein
MSGQLAVMPIATLEIDVPTWSVLVPLFGVLWTLWVNGDRAERQRRRELHARALEAVLAYREMPFMIRRRRYEVHERSAERVRLSSHLSEVQIELSSCEHLMAGDGPDWLAKEYENLVSTARLTAGKEAHEGWKVDPISDDSDVNMPELFARLKPLNDAVEEFRQQISWADRPRRGRRFRSGGPRPGPG